MLFWAAPQTITLTVMTISQGDTAKTYPVLIKITTPLET